MPPVFTDFDYFPYLKVNPSEMRAVKFLPGPDKDRTLPIIGLKKWANSKAFTNTLDRIKEDYGDRICAVDLCPVKDLLRANAEVAELLKPDNGFANWIAFIEQNEKFVPVLQWREASATDIRAQASALLGLDKGLVIRLQRDAGWNTSVIDALAGCQFLDKPVLLAVDAGQIKRNEDITLLAAQIGALVDRALPTLNQTKLTMAVLGSSFPSDFASIDRVRSRIDILERQLHAVLNQNAAHKNASYRFSYGDHASVFAGVRGIGQRGAPRIDYPTRSRWIYERREGKEGYVGAATAIVASEDWNDQLLVWGAERIRVAAKGDLTDMESPQKWTAVRIHLHLHQQVNFSSGPDGLVDTDEPWEDD